MQDTRQHILEILKDFGEATVEEIADELKNRRGEISSVTVRHHLTRLQEANLINTPELRHLKTPGRPRHIYTLTEQAKAHFPNNYQQLSANLLIELRKHLPSGEVNVILEDVADTMAEHANIRALPLAERIQQAVIYLNEHGYNASAEPSDTGFLLKTKNCPYHDIVKDSRDGLCNMDMRLISSLLGVLPRLKSRISEGDESCTYFIPNAE